MLRADWNMYFVFHSKMFAGEVVTFTTFICLLMISPQCINITYPVCVEVSVWRGEFSSNTITHNYTLLLTHTHTDTPPHFQSRQPAGALQLRDKTTFKPIFFKRKSLTAGIQIGGRDVGLWHVANPPEFLFTRADVFTQRTTIFQSEVFILVDQASNLASRLKLNL